MKFTYSYRSKQTGSQVEIWCFYYEILTPSLVEIRIDGILTLENLVLEKKTVMATDFCNFVGRTI